jgi:tRNA nucleotidyltransferase (CCA-adding enzyme)
VAPAETSGPALRRWLARVGPERLPELARLWIARARVHGSCEEPARVLEVWHAIRAELRLRPPLAVADLALGGRDLMRLGMKPGPHFKDVLARLLDRVLEDPSLNRPDVLAGLVVEWQREGETDGRAAGE